MLRENDCVSTNDRSAATNPKPAMELYAVRQLEPQPISKRPYGPCSLCRCRLLPAMERLRSCWGGLPTAVPPKRNSPDLGDRPGPLPGCEAWGPELTPSQLHGVLLFL